MVSTTSFFALLAVVATTVKDADAHGFIAEPAPTWKDKESSEWVVEIAPLWEGAWDESKGDEGLLATFKELAAKNDFKDIRTLMDGNPAFGDECGFTDPKGTPVDPPSNGAATFSRGIVHAGPCEIWLDDKMVLQNDDCQSAYGDGTKETISVFKPVDYSSCAAGGCLLRFYWLALQRLDKKALWQAYKNCIPLTGPGTGGGKGGDDPTQQAPGGDDPTQQNPEGGSKKEGDGSKKEGGDDKKEGDGSKKEGDGSKKEGGDDKKEGGDDKKEGGDNKQEGGDNKQEGGDDKKEGGDDKKEGGDAPKEGGSPEMTPVPAPSSKCKGQRRD